MTEANKKKPLGILGYIIVGVMIVVFIIQQFSPADFGKVYGEVSEGATKIEFVVQDADNPADYSTEDPEKIAEFREWISGRKLRYKTLADTLTPKSVVLKEYLLIPTAADGTMTAISLNERGLVRINARVYKITGSVDQFFEDLEAVAKTW